MNDKERISNYKMEVYCAKTVDGDQWNVVFPEVFGCGGAGDTIQEAIEDAQKNLKAHLEMLEKEVCCNCKNKAVMTKEAYEDLVMAKQNIFDLIDEKCKETARIVCSDFYKKLFDTAGSRMITYSSFCELAAKYGFEIPKETVMSIEIGEWYE